MTSLLPCWPVRWRGSPPFGIASPYVSAAIGERALGLVAPAVSGVSAVSRMTHCHHPDHHHHAEDHERATDQTTSRPPIPASSSHLRAPVAPPSCPDGWPS